jgi:hypothetical protein
MAIHPKNICLFTHTSLLIANAAQKPSHFLWLGWAL